MITAHHCVALSPVNPAPTGQPGWYRSAGRCCLLLLASVLNACDLGPAAPTATSATTSSEVVAEQQAKEREAEALRQREAEELDRLIAAMQPVYDQLEAERKRMTKLHERLTRRLGRQDMPKEHAAEIVKIMSDVNYLLRSPKQLGAFKSVAGVQTELALITAAGQRLDQVSAWVPEQR